MPRESRAVLLLLFLAVAGHAAKALLSPGPAPPGELLASVTPHDPAQQRARAVRAVRPLGATELIDLNSASAEEIARLPRIGMSLAKRIVAARTASGPFRSTGDLDRVPGVGQALLNVIGNRIRFGAVGSPETRPGNGDANTRMSGAYGALSRSAREPVVDLNSATEADLVALPGIGRARALAILAYRRENGPFASVPELGKVPGISQALVSRLAPLLAAR